MLLLSVSLKSRVKVGDRASVLGNKLPTGEWVANEVILGLPAPNPAARSGKKQEKRRPAERRATSPTRPPRLKRLTGESLITIASAGGKYPFTIRSERLRALTEPRPRGSGTQRRH